MQARFIRGAFGGKPFTLGKYENTRVRVAIAELAANGGAPMGFYTNFKDPEARKEIVRYYQFLAKHDALFRGSRPQHEVVLLFPRSHVHKGDVAPVEEFRRRGKEMLDQHILFDVVPDDLLPPRFLTVVDVTKAWTKLPNDLSKLGLSRFKAPRTVRISVDRTAAQDALVVHCVNYARQDGAPSRGKGAADEKPLAVKEIEADLVLPPGFRAGKVELLTPEGAPVELVATNNQGWLRFRVPEFLVYAVVRVELVAQK